MEYFVKGNTSADGEAIITAKSNTYEFGVKASQKEMAGPTELLLSAFAACCLKNVERFASILHYTYTIAEIEVTGIRQDKPPMINNISYTLKIASDDPHLNIELLHKNLKKFGTIYNTLNVVCEINGELILNNHV
jgi:uncharacterized OsmC-like protein